MLGEFSYLWAYTLLLKAKSSRFVNAKILGPRGLLHKHNWLIQVFSPRKSTPHGALQKPLSCDSLNLERSFSLLLDACLSALNLYLAEVDLTLPD